MTRRPSDSILSRRRMHSSGSTPSTTRTVHGRPRVSTIRQMRSTCTGSSPERPGSSHSTKRRCVLRSSHATRSSPTDLPIAGGPDRNTGRRIWPPPVGSSSDRFGEERYSTTASARLSVASRRKQYPRAAAAQSGTPMWARPANPRKATCRVFGLQGVQLVQLSVVDGGANAADLAPVLRGESGRTFGPFLRRL